MKYGITEQLDPATADRIHRVYIALLLEAHHAQVHRVALRHIDVAECARAAWRRSAPPDPPPRK